MATPGDPRPSQSLRIPRAVVVSGNDEMRMMKSSSEMSEIGTLEGQSFGGVFLEDVWSVCIVTFFGFVFDTFRICF